MNLPRRQFLHLAAGGAALPARAQTYPTRPVRLVVGFPPGGSADLISRLIGQWLSDRLGQSVFIENRAGAASNIATEFIVPAPFCLVGAPETSPPQLLTSSRKWRYYSSLASLGRKTALSYAWRNDVTLFKVAL